MAGCKPKAAPVVPVTPKSDFSGPIVIDPVTRIEGHLKMEVEVENGKIKMPGPALSFSGVLKLFLKDATPGMPSISPRGPAEYAPMCTPWLPPGVWTMLQAWTFLKTPASSVIWSWLPSSCMTI